jgi:endonuclease III
MQWTAVQSRPLVILVTKPKKKSLKVLETIEELKINYPYAHCALNFTNPFELLIATILSAQCTDERVNLVTAVLFKNFPTPQDLAQASLPEIEKIIHSAGFYKNKAKNIKSCAQTLVDKHNSIVPKNLDQLIELAGVGRKTANVVLGNAYNITSGVVVDTHVGRLATRWGWTKSASPEKIELDLQGKVPKSDWIMLSHWMIWHGRALCKARSPICEECFLFDRCPQIAV